MNIPLRQGIQIFGAWSGVSGLFLAMVGVWAFAGFFPLHEPESNANTIAAIYRDHPVTIRFGMVILMFGAMLFLPFAAVLADQISDFEKRTGPLAILAALGGFSLGMFGFYAGIWYLILSFRPERSAELSQLLNDGAWLQLVGGASLCSPLFLAVAIVALADKRPAPLFPRWAGWATLFVLLSAVPSSQLIFFFRSGPLAWNGAIGFWLPTVELTAWLVLMACLMTRAARSSSIGTTINLWQESERATP